MAIEHIRKWTVGDVDIWRIVELNDHRDPFAFLLEGGSAEQALSYDWLKPHFITPDGQMRISFQAFVIRAGERRIMVDTCIGNDRQREYDVFSNLQTSFLQDITAAGCPPDSIDTVLCTHLHVDHVGWNTMLVDGQWVPTFKNARYLMARTEFDYWKTEPDTYVSEPQIFHDSVKPVFDAGLVDLVETDHVVCDEISLVPTLGHTPGHVSIRISSKGEEALITGDFVHHPCQMAHPEWAAAPDYDPEQSTRTRHETFGALAGKPVLVIGTHFATPTAGHVVKDGDGWRLEV
jgi:glyoxylase-like metal-dependent hydrolase (beta-lactamase superfamily II)